MNIISIYIMCLVTGYLFGSVMFAPTITKLVLHKDIRKLGNRNPGAANTFKNVGPFWGILTGVLDAAKAYLPLLAAHYFFGLNTVSLGLIGLGAIFGHGFPLYFGVKGGRSAGTIMGVFIFFIPYELLISFAVIPAFTFTLLKKNRSFCTPFGIIMLSILIALFFKHSPQTKIMVLLSGFAGLFMNRYYLPIMISNLRGREKY